MAKSYYSTVLEHSVAEVWAVIRPFDHYARAGVQSETVIEARRSSTATGLSWSGGRCSTAPPRSTTAGGAISKKKEGFARWLAALRDFMARAVDDYVGSFS